MHRSALSLTRRGTHSSASLHGFVHSSSRGAKTPAFTRGPGGFRPVGEVSSEISARSCAASSNSARAGAGNLEENGPLTLYRNEKPEDRQGYLTDLFAEEAIAWLSKPGRGPFFLYLAFTAPHTPLQDPDEFDPKTGTAPWKKRHRPTYAKMVERMDRRLGDVMAQLRGMDQEDNTIVVLLSDNGADPNRDNGSLRGGKGTLWEGGIRVPCLMRWPLGLPDGKIFWQVAITMDLMPTLMHAANIPAAAARFDGMDLLPILQARLPQRPRKLFWRYKRGHIVRKAARSGDLKLVIDSQSKELHNLSTDEREQMNLLPARAREAEVLRGALAAWEKDVRAPRLRDFRPRAA